MKKNNKPIPAQVINEFKDLVYEGHNKTAESGDENDLLTLSDGRRFYSYGGDLFIYDPDRPEIEEFSEEAQVSWEQGDKNVLVRPCISNKQGEESMRKYSPKTIKQEANLYLSGKTIPTIAIELGIPVSTISWHLIHPLSKIDYRAWLAIRYRLLHRVKDGNRKAYEEEMIDNSGLSEELYHQWSAIDEERRNK